MSSASGMNIIVCSERGKHEIRNDPFIPVEIHPFYNGTGIKGRDYDIPTSQATSNGIILYYTPKSDTTETVHPPSSPSVGTSAHFEQHQPSTSRELRQGDAGAQDWSTQLRLPAQPEVIMSHSGSRGIDAEAFKQLCLGIARRSPVLAFQKWIGDTQDAEVIRTASFSYFWLMNNVSGKAMGGRSRGARCATKASVYSSNKNLILWSFPLVRDYDVRKQELLALSSDTRVLFIKGTKDWMEPEMIFGPVRREMRAKSWCIYVQNLDHNFNCKSDLQERKTCNAIGTLAGIWLNGDPEANSSPWDPEDGTEMGMAWDTEREEVVWTGWQRPGDRPPVPDIVRPDVAGAL